MSHLHSTGVTHWSSLVPSIMYCLLCLVKPSIFNLWTMCSRRNWSHSRKDVVMQGVHCFDSFSAHIRPTLIWKGHSHVLLIDLSLGPEFPHFSYRAVGNRWVKQQTCKYSSFKREKNLTLYSSWIPNPPFIPKDLRLELLKGGAFAWLAGWCFFIISIPFVNKVILTVAKKKVRFWVDRWSREPIILLA